MRINQSGRRGGCDPVTGDYIEEIRRHGINPSVILDIGSRDAIQALELSGAFPEARVFAFEALPTSAIMCRNNSSVNPKVEVVEGAVHEEHAAEVSFYPVIASSNGRPEGNPGASSLFRAINGEYHEKVTQTECRVRTLRLDIWAKTRGVDRFDVVWMDLQGAELLALRGMGELIQTVSAIHLEMCLRPLYFGQGLYAETDEYLRGHGFRQVWFHERVRGWWGDGVYVRQ